MKNRIELLDIDLMQDQEKLDEIDHWARVLNWPNGWHYDLDIIWALKNVEDLKLPPRSTILDAGAGLGLTQFILASRGFNIISLDFSERKIPKKSKGIFNINVVDAGLGEYHHSYMDFMTYGQRAEVQKSGPSRLIKRIVSDPRSIAWLLKSKISTTLNLYHFNKERKKEHGQYGTITFLKGTFNKIPLESASVDAIVSISAFEHNTYADMPDSIQEFNRILKNGSFMFIATSAAEREDWFHKPSQGWCLTSQTLSKWFAIDNISFEYKKHYQEITQSKKLEKRICAYYKMNDDNGLPYGKLKQAPYIPLGIVKQKDE